FEDNGGKVVQKLWTPLNAPDYGTYISQLKPDLDAVYTGHAGSNGFKFIRQLREYGNKVQILGGFTPVDESLLQQMGEDAVGAIYLRKVEKKDGRYVNAVIKTYPDVSQFWTYKQDEFLKNPVYSRDYPPAKNLEQ